MGTRPMKTVLAPLFAIVLGLGAALPSSGFARAEAGPTYPAETVLPQGPYTLIGTQPGATYYLLPSRHKVIGKEIETAMLGIFIPARNVGGPVTFALVTERFNCATRTFYGTHMDMFDETGGHIDSLDHVTPTAKIEANSPSAAAAAILCDGGPAEATAATSLEALGQARASKP